MGGKSNSAYFRLIAVSTTTKPLKFLQISSHCKLEAQTIKKQKLHAL